MTKTFNVGDYAVNHVGSVGIITKDTERDYLGTWYNGGSVACEMNCAHNVLERHAELDDIMSHVPRELQAEAILALSKRMQRENAPKYGVGDFVKSKYGKDAVGLITDVTGQTYLGKWYRNGKEYLGMDCAHSVIDRKATWVEVVQHVPNEIRNETTNVEEEVAMTTVEYEVDAEVVELLKAEVSLKEAEALDDFTSCHRGKSPEQTIAYYVEHSNMWASEWKPLREMGAERFVRAILNGYKLAEPTFNVGFDKVVYIGDGLGFKGVGEVIGKGTFTYRIKVEGEYHGAYPKNLRLATEEELMWDAMGREVGEFRLGDRYMFGGELHLVFTERTLDVAVDRYAKGRVKGVYPRGTYVDFTKGGKA